MFVVLLDFPREGLHVDTMCSPSRTVMPFAFLAFNLLHPFVMPMYQQLDVALNIP